MLNNFFDKFIFTNALKFKHNNFFLINVPFVIAPVEMLVGLLSFEDANFNKKLYSTVKDSVKKNLIKDLSQEFGYKGERMLSFLEEFFSASGWGSIKTLNIDFAKSEAIVSVSDNPFVPFLSAQAKKPVDVLLRAVLAGIFCRAFEKDVDCIELKCSAVGASECEFVLKLQKDFDLGSKLAREQLPLEL